MGYYSRNIKHNTRGTTQIILFFLFTHPESLIFCQIHASGNKLRTNTEFNDSVLVFFAKSVTYTFGNVGGLVIINDPPTISW